MLFFKKLFFCHIEGLITFTAGISSNLEFKSVFLTFEISASNNNMIKKKKQSTLFVCYGLWACTYFIIDKHFRRK